MNHKPNTVKWSRGAIVIHDADAKEPKMLMKVVGYTRDGLVKTQYVDRRHKRKIWKNPMEALHDPARFGINNYWGNYAQEHIETVQREWERVRRWNLYYPPGTLVRTTSADGGFEAVTRGKALMDAGGSAMIYLKPGMAWALEFVELVKENDAEARAFMWTLNDSASIMDQSE